MHKSLHFKWSFLLARSNRFPLLSCCTLITPDFPSCCAGMSSVLLFQPTVGFARSPVHHLFYLWNWVPVALSLQLIIGFESGIVVLWDLKSKKADYRYTYDEVGKSPWFISSLSATATTSSTRLPNIWRYQVIKSHTCELSYIQLYQCVKLSFKSLGFFCFMSKVLVVSLHICDKMLIIQKEFCESRSLSL